MQPSPGRDRQLGVDMIESSPAERFLPVVGYEGYYEVGDCGTVRSVDRIIHRSDGSDLPLKGGALATVVNEAGYHRVDLYVYGSRRTLKVHRLVLAAFVGPCPDSMEGCHADDDKDHNHLSNLRWDTRSANRYDAVRTGHDHLSGRQACPYEHRLEVPNLVPGALRKGRRACKACSDARSFIGLRRRRGLPAPDFRSEADRRYLRIMGTP